LHLVEKLMTEPSKSEESALTIIALSEVKQQMSPGESEEEADKPLSKFGQWEEWPNEDGVSYFFNKETGESQWDDPRLQGAAAALTAVLTDAPTDEVQQEKTEDEEKQPEEKKNLVRDASVHKWELDDIESMKSDMLAQLHILQSETRKSGARMPTLRKKYRPARAPPVEPPTPKAQKLEISVMNSLRENMEKPEKPTTIPPIPIQLPNVPKSLPPVAPVVDLPASYREYSGSVSVSVDDVGTRSADEMFPRGRAKNRESQMSINSEFLSTDLSHNLYIAVSDFVPDDNTKIELKEGDYITLQKKKGGGWWVGKNESTGKSGYFPGSYVKRANSELGPMRRSKSQEVSSRKSKAGMHRGKMMHSRSRNLRRKSRGKKGKVTRKSSQIRKRRNTRMGD